MENHVKNTTSFEIFLLVKGLTSSEKAYYKKMSKRHADQNAGLHLKLFKLLDESKAYDEEILYRSLNIKNRIHYSIIKSYLSKDILNTLVFQKRNKCIDTQLYFMKDQINICLGKNLFNLALKECKKALAIAAHNEKYYFVPLLLQLENRIWESKDYKYYRSVIPTSFPAVESAVQSQYLFDRNKLLYEKIRALTFRSWLPITGEELNEVKNISMELAGHEPSDEEQPLILLYYLNTLSICEYLLHFNQNCSETCGKIFHLWKKNTHLIDENASLFLHSVHTTCYNDFSNRDVVKAGNSIVAYETLASNFLSNESDVQYFEVIRFNTELKRHIKTGNIEVVRELIENNAALIISYSSKILSPADQLSIKCSICIAYFILEHWSDAESLMIEIKDQNKQINRQDVLYFSLIFHLAILFEQKEWYRLDYAREAAYHYLYARKKLRPFERELMLFIGRWSINLVRKNDDKIIEDFLQRLDYYRNDPAKNLYFLYFNYYGWLESKLLKVKYMEYIKLKAVPQNE